MDKRAELDHLNLKLRLLRDDSFKLGTYLEIVKTIMLLERAIADEEKEKKAAGTGTSIDGIDTEMLDTLDMNRLRSGNYRCLNPANQDLFDKVQRLVDPADYGTLYARRKDFDEGIRCWKSFEVFPCHVPPEAIDHIELKFRLPD